MFCFYGFIGLHGFRVSGLGVKLSDVFNPRESSIINSCCRIIVDNYTV